MSNIKVDKQRLITVRDYFKKDEKEYFISGKFEQLQSNIVVNKALKKPIPPIEAYIRYIIEDIDDVFQLIDKISWEHGLFKIGEIDMGKWLYYGKLDIELFHIKIKSVFDYIAKIIKRTSKHPENVPDKTYNELVEWLNKSEENRGLIGNSLSKILILCDWFEFIKDIRDSDVHRGASTLVYLTEEAITFQVHKGYNRKVVVPELMYNKNVAYFDRYSALLIANLLYLLETVSDLIIKEVKMDSLKTNPRRVFNEKPKFLDWLDNLISLL